MKISVHVTPRSGKNEVICTGDRSYRVRITASPVEGKANDMLIEVLAGYFHKPKRNLSIVSGESGRRKIVEII
jgi:uncharacterized protein (TIGR00251 family)